MDSYISIKHTFSYQLYFSLAVYKDAAQPAHPYSSISTCVFPCLDSAESIHSKSKISSRELVSVGEKVGLNPTWSQTPENVFSNDMAQFNS